MQEWACIGPVSGVCKPCFSTGPTQDFTVRFCMLTKVPSGTLKDANVFCFLYLKSLCVPVIVNDNKDAFVGCMMEQNWLVSIASVGLKMDSLKTP